MSRNVTKCYRVYGIVQGVGFRPTVSRHACECHISGCVSNKGPYVEIYASGAEDNVLRFRSLIEKQPPKRAVILNIREIPAGETPSFDGFNIIESEKTKGEIFISPDIAICDDCKKELYDPTNKRYLHPFINCTCCGPRLTILDSLPYDRVRTSMSVFPMCPYCAGEYKDPKSRRYDAQPVCCLDCGPEVYLIGSDIKGSDAITYTRKIISSGKVAAIKGIGGFHLCCSAESDEAVSLLRARKRRPAKPFAVMARDIDSAKKACDMTPAQEAIIDGHQKPILLLDRRKGSPVSELCAPGNPKIGIMLPYAPIHLLLFDYNDGIKMPDYLVMTSANESGAPICRDDEDALEQLSGLCDCMLSHNRMIRIRADDTVMDFYKDNPYMVRRSRGYAPLPLSVSAPLSGQVLAAGGELKNTFCLGINNLFYLSPYVGDLEDVRTAGALKETIQRFESLLEADPSFAVCDMHPLYSSSETVREMGKEIIPIQHHYAHVLSCMAENDCLDKVIGIAYDGTGYGTDKTIWGGEILTADCFDFDRAAHIAPFPQAGGDASAKEGWRIAAGMTAALSESRDEELKRKLRQILSSNGCESCEDVIDRLSICSASDYNIIKAMIRGNINTVTSTSCGRLFDAAAAVLGICRASTYEGEAACAMQFKALEYLKRQRVRESSNYKNIPEDKSSDHPNGYLHSSCSDPEDGGMSHVSLKKSESYADHKTFIMRTDNLFLDLISGALSGGDADYLAWYFHRRLADMTIETACLIREDTGINTAVLTGGVYQNTLLLEMCDEGLAGKGFKVLIHHMVPPNDGGISLGQALYGAFNADKGR